MTRPTQNLLLILLGQTVLWITLATDEYLNYVKPGFLFPLVSAGVLLTVLGGAGIYQERRDTGQDDHADHGGCGGHGHARAPRVAWLLLLPALAVFLIAPPPLGSFTAARPDTRPTVSPTPAAGETFRPLPETGPVEMKIGEFLGRTWQEQSGTTTGLRGRQVRLIGFVTPHRTGSWFLTRMQIACCAADGIPMQIIVIHRRPAPPADSWVQVTGTWVPPRPKTTGTPVQRLAATSVQRIAEPVEPYE